MIKRAEWLLIAKDRAAVLLLAVMVIEVIIIIITTIVRLHASDVQVPTRYTAYGTANIYRGQWYSLWLFSAFAVLITLINGLLAVKTYQMDKVSGKGLIGFTIFILMIELFVVNAIFNLAPSV